MPAADAKVAVDDAGFQHGVGLFETFAVRHGRAFRLPQHLQRLADSARELGLAETLDPAALTRAVEQTIAHNNLGAARVRLTLTAGTLSLLKPTATGPVSGGASGGASGGPSGGASGGVQRTVAIVPSPPTVYDPAYFERGITVTIHGPCANPFDETAGHKTLNYWSRLRSLRRAATLGAGETIWLNITNHLASGAVSNIFLVKDGKLLTPIAHGEEVEGAMRAPVLPGVTRAAVIELAEAQGIMVERRMLSVEELLNADEVFLTNSGWGVLPVTAVEKNRVGGGGVGLISQRMIESLRDVVSRETRHPR